MSIAKAFAAGNSGEQRRPPQSRTKSDDESHQEIDDYRAGR
jgi:hypothetical protein